MNSDEPKKESTHAQSGAFDAPSNSGRANGTNRGNATKGAKRAGSGERSTDAGKPAHSDSRRPNANGTGKEIEYSPGINFRKMFNPSTKTQATALTDELIAEYCAELGSCIFDELAAASVGMSVNSLKEWVRQGRAVHEFLWFNMQTHCDGTEAGEARFAAICEDLTYADWQVHKLYTERRKAKAESERADLDFISKARSKDWKAAAYRLKIRNRERYGEGEKSTQVNISAGDGNFEIQVVNYEDYVTGGESAETIEVEAIEEENG